MKTTRRNFIQIFGTATAVAIGFINPVESIFGKAIIKDELSLIIAGNGGDPLTYLTSRHFSRLVNTSVRVQADEKHFVHLKLVEVKELHHTANEERGFSGESFSLLFQSSNEIKLSQNIYKIKHDVLGEFSLFLVPVGIKGNRCEAIINRISR